MKNLSLLQPSLNGATGADIILSKSLTHIQYAYANSPIPQNLIDFNNIAPDAIRKAGGAFSGNTQFKSIMAQYYNLAIADGIVSVNLSFGSYFWLELTENVTSFEIINAAPNAVTFTLVVKQHPTNIKAIDLAFTGSAVRWANNSPPYAVVSDLSDIDIFSFSSIDQGINWFAKILGQNFRGFNI